MYSDWLIKCQSLKTGIANDSKPEHATAPRRWSLAVHASSACKLRLGDCRGVSMPIRSLALPCCRPTRGLVRAVGCVCHSLLIVLPKFPKSNRIFSRGVKIQNANQIPKNQARAAACIVLVVTLAVVTRPSFWQ